MERVAAVAEDLDGSSAPHAVPHAVGIAEPEICECVSGVSGTQRILRVPAIEVEGFLRRVTIQESVRLMSQLNPELHIVVAVRPRDETSVLIGPDPVRLRTIVSAAVEGLIAGQIQQRSGRLKVG